MHSVAIVIKGTELFFLDAAGDLIDLGKNVGTIEEYANRISITLSNARVTAKTTTSKYLPN
jgi:hypothetical protein